MDKETLSHYGWIVVLILILSVMIALASPFGNFIKTAIMNTTTALVDMSNEGLDIIGGGNGGNTGDGETGGDTGGEITCEHSSKIVNCLAGFKHEIQCDICYEVLKTEACIPMETGYLLGDYYCEACGAELIPFMVYYDNRGYCWSEKMDHMPGLEAVLEGATTKWIFENTYTITGDSIESTADFGEYVTEARTYEIVFQLITKDGEVLREMYIQTEMACGHSNTEARNMGLVHTYYCSDCGAETGPSVSHEDTEGTGFCNDCGAVIE